MSAPLLDPAKTDLADCPALFAVELSGDVARVTHGCRPRSGPGIRRGLVWCDRLAGVAGIPNQRVILADNGTRSGRARSIVDRDSKATLSKSAVIALSKAVCPG
jgi:hypothetical protein